MKRERHNLEECGRIRVWYSALKKETLSIRNGITMQFLLNMMKVRKFVYVLICMGQARKHRQILANINSQNKTENDV